MGISWIKAEPPPPMVLVPPLFDFPPIAARTRMSVPAYELLFGKLSLHNLFEDYFDQAGQITSIIMLRPLEDPHVNLIATVSAPADKNCGTKVKGDALFRWQRDLDNPHTFMDLLVSTSKPMLQMRSCAYYPKYCIGAFGTFPLLMGKRAHSEDYGVIGVRYGSESLSLGASFVPFPLPGEIPIGAWLVGRKGSLSAGIQYKPLSGSKHPMSFADLKNWNCAISYGVGSTSPLSPSFIFALELARSTELIASFYQHLVVQRRVNNPFEDDQIVGITNYIDVGLELATMIDKDKPTESADNSLFQMAASWQANKNFLLKGATSYGFGIRVEDLRQPSYQRADPNYVMLTPSKEHLAPGVLREYGKRPMFQVDIDSGNYDHLPTELKPIGKIF